MADPSRKSFLSEDRPQHRSPWKAWLVHGLRVALIAAILALMHRQHVRFQASQNTKPTFELTDVQPLFPSAARLERAENPTKLGVLDRNGTELGFVIQTSPESDPYRGFSGPTNLLIGFGTDQRIVGVRVLTSRDTRDHVALIERDPRFFQQWIGLTGEQAAQASSVDHVTGATLTSLALAQGIQTRLGATTTTSKFPLPLTVSDVQQLFPLAEQLTQDESISSLWHVHDSAGQPIGSVLRTSPSGDEIIGFQGPTEARIGIRLDGTLTGIAVGSTFDNEPYVTYVREDDYFRSLFARYQLNELAALDLQAAGVEGVSGATMTSLAIARSLVKAAADLESRQQVATETSSVRRRDQVRTATTFAIVAVGLLLGFTPLKGRVWLRRIYQLLVILILGLVHGELLSLAMFVGWAQSGLPRHAFGLVCLSIAAISVPLIAKQNVYCSHLCPHGAVQQLLPRRFRYAGRLPKWFMRGLVAIRPALLLWVVFVAMTQAPFSLVDIEPFDAYSWRAAAWPTCAVAIVGIVVSLFIPMAYCRFGCPTGAVLDYVRRHAQSDRFTRSDLVAVACLVLGGIAGEATWPPPADSSHEPAPAAITLPSPKALSGRSMGTTWSIQGISGDKDSTLATRMKVQSRLDQIESTFSLYRPDSRLSQFNSDPAGEISEGDTDLSSLTLRAVDLSRRSKGGFSPTIGPLSRLWKLRELSADWQCPSPEAINRTRQRCDIDQLRFSLHPPVIRKCRPDIELDLNALVEGLALQSMAEIVRSQGVRDALIEIGGESLAIGQRPWTIGVADPLQPSQILTRVTLCERAISTSGTTRQKFQVGGRIYSHILDPRTGTPVEHDLVSVTVIHEDPVEADGWATALLVLGPIDGPQLAQQSGLAALFVTCTENRKAVIQRTTAFKRFELDASD